MNLKTALILLICSLITIMHACQSSREEPPTETSEPIDSPSEVRYHGIFTSSKYDSVVNHLILYPNETFALNQVDRIAEHYLNERDHQGIYSYLADSTQLGLYSEDGVLMLRFLIQENGLIPMTVGGERVLDSTNLWNKMK